MSRRLRTIAPLWLLATACADYPTCSDAAAFAPSVELGIGETEFLPVVDGTSLPTAWGIQGGQHVWVGVRTSGVLHRPRHAPDRPQIDYELTMDGSEIGGGHTARPLFGSLDDAVLVGDELFLDYVDPAQIPADAVYVASVAIHDVCGTTLQDSHNVTIEW